MNRLDRLQAIIIQLQTKKVVKAQEIADRFEISLRTVYRDIRAIEKAGVPVGAEAGIGYFLAENYNLPPIMLTSNEASSILLAGKFIPYLTDKKIQESFDSAMYKIKAVLNPEQKESISKLESSIQVSLSLTPQELPDSIYIQEIQKALVNQQVIKMSYFSNYNKTTTTRTIEPISLLYYASNWHLIAFCHLRNEFRDFRLDRINELTLLDTIYVREIGKDYKAYIEKQHASIEMHQITIEIPTELSEIINESKYWYGFVKQKKHKNQIQMQFLNPDINSFARWLLTLGPSVKIISPSKLLVRVSKLIKELYGNYL